MNEILTFSLIALLLVVSPGPNGVLIIKTASSQGRMPSFLNILGLTSATFVHGAFSIFGLSALLLQSAEIFLVIKILGAAYLFYIGARAIVQSFKKVRTEKAVDAEVAVSPRTTRGFLAEGFITQILNPKVSMFYLAAFPQFISPGSFSYLDAFVLVAIHAVIIFTWFVGVTYTIDRIRTSAKNSAVGQWVQRLSGSAMIYFSALVLSQKA